MPHIETSHSLSLSLDMGHAPQWYMSHYETPLQAPPLSHIGNPDMGSSMDEACLIVRRTGTRGQSLFGPCPIMRISI